MKALIEMVNSGADFAVTHCWPIFWQSSLLILLLFGLDLATRKLARPAVRYAFWMALLLKLVLPPSMALPTGAAWWLRPQVVSLPRTHVGATIRYGGTTLPALKPGPPIAFKSIPSARVSFESALLLVWVGGSLALIACMLWRWHRVARIAQRASPAPSCVCAQIENLLTIGKHPVFQRPPRLKVSPDDLSPFVYGLLRPEILLPRVLLESLSPAEMRAVLLHELMHLRRWDVWVNCAQALLQAIYWWHPLLWLANGRIRCLREEAVDDAVMLELDGEADGYAPALLEVAKLARPRPLASLGLVGILELRSSLKKRLERLLDSHPTKRGGGTLVPVLGVLAFSALTLPMGPAPAARSAELGQSSLSAASEETHENPPLYTRVITIPDFERHLRAKIGRSQNESLRQLFMTFIASLGIDLGAPGRTFFYTKGEETLLVKATLAELNEIEKGVQALQMVDASPLNIKVRIVEINSGAEGAPDLDLFVSDFIMMNDLSAYDPGHSIFNTATNWWAALAEQEALALLQKLNARPEVKLPCEASVTTLSDRQAEIQWGETYTNFSLSSTNIIPCLARLDLLPHVDVAGSAVELTATADFPEFLGCTKDDDAVPKFGIHRYPVSAEIGSGQTLVIGGLTSENQEVFKTIVCGIPGLLPSRFLRVDRVSKGSLLIFITTNVLKEAGETKNSSGQ